ncbi:flavodoxin family protein [Salibacterium salarium]|uniref:Flavodoxin family protein n=1 Tax=Salibacterium salarium TaxID=284579 RepID=A0A3R9P4L4_9BACI|nr:NAD(P)H-dependent oxidoreductase [Salibacterium salarium]RSL30987.1 flavodoxin family protein [Salibacterium salarium]
MDRFVLWFMHPDCNSFNGAIMETLKKALESLGKEVKVRDIHEIGLSPILTRKEYEDSLKGVYPEEIQKEHRYIDWADVIVLVFPLWWGNFPAAGKGFLDRVLSYGFAYELKEETPIPKLQGKKVGAVYTTGAPEEAFAKSKNHIEKTWEAQIFQFCGFQTIPFLHFGDVVQATDETRKQMLQDVKDYAKQNVSK